jgi:hypothetical protein
LVIKMSDSGSTTSPKDKFNATEGMLCKILNLL